MQRLRVRLFGPVELYLGNKRLPEFPTRKSKFLFAYLVLNPGRVLSRDVVATEFWGDLPDVRARKALNTEFWRIGQLLRNVGLDPDNYLRSVSDGVGFLARAAYSLDIAQFDAALSQVGTTAPEKAEAAVIDRVSEAVALYRGDLMLGVFDDWCLVPCAPSPRRT
jgi:DNA-binding SARP family transcriptional activator